MGTFVNCGFKPAFIMIKKYGAYSRLVYLIVKEIQETLMVLLQANITQAEEKIHHQVKV